MVGDGRVGCFPLKQRSCGGIFRKQTLFLSFLLLVCKIFLVFELILPDLPKVFQLVRAVLLLTCGALFLERELCFVRPMERVLQCYEAVLGGFERGGSGW